MRTPAHVHTCICTKNVQDKDSSRINRWMCCIARQCVHNTTSKSTNITVLTCVYMEQKGFAYRALRDGYLTIYGPCRLDNATRSYTTPRPCRLASHRHLVLYLFLFVWASRPMSTCRCFSSSPVLVGTGVGASDALILGQPRKSGCSPCTDSQGST